MDKSAYIFTHIYINTYLVSYVGIYAGWMAATSSGGSLFIVTAMLRANIYPREGLAWEVTTGV